MRHIPGVINPPDKLSKPLGWVLGQRHANARVTPHYCLNTEKVERFIGRFKCGTRNKYIVVKKETRSLNVASEGSSGLLKLVARCAIQFKITRVSSLQFLKKIIDFRYHSYDQFPESAVLSLQILLILLMLV